MTDAGVGVGKAVRVGHNLQEDIHLVQDGGEGGVMSVISHNLVRGLEKQQSVQPILEQQLQGKLKKGNRSTFFANQVPLAWVTHSLEWMPVSIQMAGRLP